LRRYVIQETTEKRVTFYFRSPREGIYYFTVYAQPVSIDQFLSEEQGDRG